MGRPILEQCQMVYGDMERMNNLDIETATGGIRSKQEIGHWHLTNGFDLRQDIGGLGDDWDDNRRLMAA